MALALFGLSHNVVGALARRNIDIDFSFLDHPAGFDIPFHLVAWNGQESYFYALLVALLNTLLASMLAVVAASVLGVVFALLCLSANPMSRVIGHASVELVRNTPQLLQILFFYFVTLQVLPPPRLSLSVAGAFFLNVRGLLLPAPDSPWFVAICTAAVVGSIVLPRCFRRLSLLLTAVLPLVAGILLAVLATRWTFPTLQGFNFTGGWRLPPELLALSVGISVYTSGFIAENVRASIQAIGQGQRDAARAVGLSPAKTMRLVILPQALQTLLPPLTNNYLNIVKSTTLGAAIAYPEILQVFARTVLNQSGRAVEVMTLVLCVYLTLSLGLSAAINGWNRRLARQSR